MIINIHSSYSIENKEWDKQRAKYSSLKASASFLTSAVLPTKHFHYGETWYIRKQERNIRNIPRIIYQQPKWEKRATRTKINIGIAFGWRHLLASFTLFIAGGKVEYSTKRIEKRDLLQGWLDLNNRPRRHRCSYLIRTGYQWRLFSLRFTRGVEEGCISCTVCGWYW